MNYRGGFYKCFQIYMKSSNKNYTIIVKPKVIFNVIWHIPLIYLDILYTVKNRSNILDRKQRIFHHLVILIFNRIFILWQLHTWISQNTKYCHSTKKWEKCIISKHCLGRIKINWHWRRYSIEDTYFYIVIVQSVVFLDLVNYNISSQKMICTHSYFQGASIKT